MELNKIYNQDCLEGMKQLEDNSVDLIVTDPPYGYSFMGKEWDKAVPSIDIWKECLRVLKNGAFAFIMSAPRQDVQAEMIKRLDESGFVVGFTPLYWAYASGFPKAGNISKMVDKRLGAERERIPATGGLGKGTGNTVGCFTGECVDNKPITPQAKALDGSYSGFQPKPAVEIILVAMKPLSEKTYVDQALKNGHGITWLDDCRVPYESNDEPQDFGTPQGHCHGGGWKPQKRGNINSTSIERKYGYKNCVEIGSSKGRFPANLLVSDDVLNDGNITEAKGGDINAIARNDIFDTNIKPRTIHRPCDSGSFSRYFDLDKWHINKLPKSAQKTFPFMIVPKASSGEKNDGCEDFNKEQVTDGCIRSNQETARKYGANSSERKNTHPTVKPLKLMKYLITLGSRQNNLILDPFIGSGTTAIASRQLTRNFIGFELNKEYHEIALARIKEELAQQKLGEYNNA